MITISQICFVLDKLVDEALNLLLVGYALSDRVSSCRVNFLSQEQ
jgi:hypothetical protein